VRGEKCISLSIFVEREREREREREGTKHGARVCGGFSRVALLGLLKV